MLLLEKLLWQAVWIMHSATQKPPSDSSVLTAVKGSSPLSKAAAISNAINAVSTQQLSQNPSDWFMFAAAYVTIDPPGTHA